ncbi:MAG: purine-nucleoside phosphorylase [Acidobacteriota bacterium]
MSAVGIVLGSGLGGFAHSLEQKTETRYSEIPGWPVSTVPGHAGKLISGMVGNREVIVLAGRVHLYEGFTPQQVTFGIRALAQRGVRSLILTNAAGGINLSYQAGELVLISDHINLQGANPLIAPRPSDDDEAPLGPRFPDMSDAYSHEYRVIARSAGVGLGLALKDGVYAGVPGPSFETPAEIRYMRTIGADLVGMSTVMENIAANEAGMKVLGISCVTNMAAGVSRHKLTHQEVLEAGDKVKGTLTALLRAVVQRLP